MPTHNKQSVVVSLSLLVRHTTITFVSTYYCLVTKKWIRSVLYIMLYLILSAALFLLARADDEFPSARVFLQKVS